MSKGKKFSAAEKHFQGIIDSKNKSIKNLIKIKDELANENYELIKENETLKTKLEYANRAIKELNKLTNLSSEDIKELVSKTHNMNTVCDLLTGKVTRDLLGGY